MTEVAAFPQLSQPEFVESCTAFQHRFEQHKQDQAAWISVDLAQKHNIDYLQITKLLHIKPATTPSIEAEDDEVEQAQEDEDEESLPQAPDAKAPTVLIHYDIILSPTYCVPTLYIHISDSLHRFPPTLDTLYTHIIPSQYASQTQDVGVLGGITIIDHPVYNRPVFFIHPCRTAEVMEAIAGGRQVSAEEYLMLWIGAMGKCVGLDVPLILASPGSDHE